MAARVAPGLKEITILLHFSELPRSGQDNIQGRKRNKEEKGKEDARGCVGLEAIRPGLGQSPCLTVCDTCVTATQLPGWWRHVENP